MVRLSTLIVLLLVGLAIIPGIIFFYSRSEVIMSKIFWIILFTTLSLMGIVIADKMEEVPASIYRTILQWSSLLCTGWFFSALCFKLIRFNWTYEQDLSVSDLDQFFKYLISFSFGLFAIVIYKHYSNGSLRNN